MVSQRLKLGWIVLWLVPMMACQSLPPRGGLVAQVQKWATEIEDDMLTLTEEILFTQKVQQLFDSSPYKIQFKNGNQVADEVQDTLADYFVKREQALNVSDDLTENHV